MLFTHPEIEKPIDTEEPSFHTLVIESPSLFRRLLTDVSEQIGGSEGQAVLSVSYKPVEFSKSAEILDGFLPFEINRRPLLTKVCAALEKNAVSPEHMPLTLQRLSELESYLMDLSFDFPCDIVFSKLNVGALLKAAAPVLRCDSDRLSEQILDYMELVMEFDRQKLFITVNLRSYIEDEEFFRFSETVLSHGYHVLAIENREFPRAAREKRIVIDRDLCEIT